MSKKSAAAQRKPPPAVDRAAAERVVSTGVGKAKGSKTAPSKALSAPAPRRRAIVTRADGRELRRMTIYLPPELARRLAVYAARTDTDVSAAISAICEDFLARTEP